MGSLVNRPLIVLAIGVGNAAYQSGNFGAAIGLTTFFPERFASIILFLSAIAAILILSNRYRWLERSLVALVVLMAVLFLGLAFILLPNLLALPAERLTPDSVRTTPLVLALIGTTIVPYNLFLHATAARREMGEHGTTRRIAGGEVGILHHHHDRRRYHTGDPCLFATVLLATPRIPLRWTH